MRLLDLQGFTLDMEALAKALSFIPLHQVLGLDPSFFPDEPPEPAKSASSLTVRPAGPAALPADTSSIASVPTADLKPGADARVSSSDGLQSSHIAGHSKQISSTSDERLPMSQPTAAPAAELQTARPSRLADIEPGEMQGRGGPDLDRPPHPTSAKASSNVMPADTASVPSCSSPSNKVQQPVPYKPTSSAAASSESSGSRSGSQVQRPIRSHRESSPRASGVTTGSSNTGAIRHAALGSSGRGISMSHTRSVAAKPSDDAAAAVEDDDELDALLGMGSVAGSKSERPQIGSSKHDACDDDDLDALLSLGRDEVPRVAKPQKSSRAPSGSRQQPDDDSLGSFLDSL